jgi:hypothetical protein
VVGGRIGGFLPWTGSSIGLKTFWSGNFFIPTGSGAVSGLGLSGELKSSCDPKKTTKWIQNTKAGVDRSVGFGELWMAGARGEGFGLPNLGQLWTWNDESFNHKRFSFFGIGSVEKW